MRTLYFTVLAPGCKKKNGDYRLPTFHTFLSKTRVVKDVNISGETFNKSRAQTFFILIDNGKTFQNHFSSANNIFLRLGIWVNYPGKCREFSQKGRKACC